MDQAPGFDVDRIVVTRVLRERVLALCWGSALLLHVAEPRIAQGVADHSIFLHESARRLDRLSSTANTMLALLVGAPRDAETAATRINRIHDQVHGVLREGHPGMPPGTTYSAHDPMLLMWVHVALHATLLRAFEAAVGPLSEADQDGYCRAVASVEPLLGIPDGRLPRHASTLRHEFEVGLSRLSVGEHALWIAHGILYPPLPCWLGPVARLARLWTVGFLPESVRAAYGLRWGRQEARLFDLSLRLARGVLPRVPAGLRCVPPELMLRWQSHSVNADGQIVDDNLPAGPAGAGGSHERASL